MSILSLFATAGDKQIMNRINAATRIANLRRRTDIREYPAAAAFVSIVLIVLPKDSGGWCYGEEAFRKELLGQMVGRAGENHHVEDRQESDAEKARRIVAAELKRLNWTESELRRRRKGDPKKVRIARRLREKTTMTLKWIAGELCMGAWTHVSNLLSQARGGKK